MGNSSGVSSGGSSGGPTGGGPQGPEPRGPTPEPRGPTPEPSRNEENQVSNEDNHTNLEEKKPFDPVYPNGPIPKYVDLKGSDKDSINRIFTCITNLLDNGKFQGIKPTDSATGISHRDVC